MTSNLAKNGKKLLWNFKRFCVFLLFWPPKWHQNLNLTWSAQHNLGVPKFFDFMKFFIRPLFLPQISPSKLFLHFWVHLFYWTFVELPKLCQIPPQTSWTESVLVLFRSQEYVSSGFSPSRWGHLSWPTWGSARNPRSSWWRRSRWAGLEKWQLSYFFADVSAAVRACRTGNMCSTQFVSAVCCAAISRSPPPTVHDFTVSLRFSLARNFCDAKRHPMTFLFLTLCNDGSGYEKLQKLTYIWTRILIKSQCDTTSTKRKISFCLS